MWRQKSTMRTRFLAAASVLLLFVGAAPAMADSKASAPASGQQADNKVTVPSKAVPATVPAHAPSHQAPQDGPMFDGFRADDGGEG
jgi:hypothetical protein